MNPTITVRLSLDCVKKIIFSKSKNDNKLGFTFYKNNQKLIERVEGLIPNCHLKLLHGEFALREFDSWWEK